MSAHQLLHTAKAQRQALAAIAESVADALRAVPGGRPSYRDSPAQKYSGNIIGHAIEDTFTALSTAECDAVAALLVNEGFLEPSKGTSKLELGT